jgi:hypothetical protein
MGQTGLEHVSPCHWYALFTKHCTFGDALCFQKLVLYVNVVAVAVAVAVADADAAAKKVDAPGCVLLPYASPHFAPAEFVLKRGAH